MADGEKEKRKWYSYLTNFYWYMGDIVILKLNFGEEYQTLNKVSEWSAIFYYLILLTNMRLNS